MRGPHCYHGYITEAGIGNLTTLGVLLLTTVVLFDYRSWNVVQQLATTHSWDRLQPRVRISICHFIYPVCIYYNLYIPFYVLSSVHILQSVYTILCSIQCACTAICIYHFIYYPVCIYYSLYIPFYVVSSVHVLQSLWNSMFPLGANLFCWMTG